MASGTSNISESLELGNWSDYKWQSNQNQDSFLANAQDAVGLFVSTANTPANITANWTTGDARGAVNGTNEGLYSVPVGIVVLLSLLYGSISLISILGNILVILVICKNKNMHTVTNFFIANLSVADVVIGIFSIPFQFQAALSQRWDLPYILCPVAPFVKEVTVNVSVLTLTVISIDRYFAVLHPLKPRCSRHVAKVVMTIVWLFSIGSGLPTAIAFRVIILKEDSGIGTKPFCSPKFPDWNWIDVGKVYRLYLTIVQYFFPLIIICVSYFRIMYRIWFTKAPGMAESTRDKVMNRNKHKVIKMLLIVVALFAFCWLPLQTYLLFSEISTAVNQYRFINIIWFCSNWLAMSNSCYNPFIYGLLNEKFKHGFWMLFVKCPSTCCQKELIKDPFAEQSEASDGLRKQGGSVYEDTRYQVNNGQLKRYMRVGVATESTYV